MNLRAAIDPRTLVGKLGGYGDCLRCGNTWNWKKGYSISYGRGCGMFPLCEECWKATAINEKKFYVKQLVDEWRGLNLRYPTECSPLGTLNGQSFGKILANAYKAIEWEEKGVKSSHAFESEPDIQGGVLMICNDQSCLWHKEDGRFVWTIDKWILKK
mgnify:FL=1